MDLEKVVRVVNDKLVGMLMRDDFPHTHVWWRIEDAHWVPQDTYLFNVHATLEEYQNQDDMEYLVQHLREAEAQGANWLIIQEQV